MKHYDAHFPLIANINFDKPVMGLSNFSIE